jgi:predicted transposase YdaD
MPESVLEDAKIAEAKNKTVRIYATIEHEKGVVEGKIEGKIEERRENILKPYKKGKSVAQISEFLDLTIEEIQKVIDEYEASQR